MNAGHYLDQRRLAGTVVAQQGHDFAGVDGEVHLRQRPDVAEVTAEATSFQQRCILCQFHLFRRTSELITTAVIMIAPMAPRKAFAGMLNKTRPVRSIPVRVVPMTVPAILP